MKSFSRHFLASAVGLLASALLIAAPAFAEAPPIQELDGSSPAPALSAGGEKLLADAASKVGPAAAYPVDYVNFVRNVLLIATIFLTMHYIGSAAPAKKKKRGSETKRGGTGKWLLLAAAGLLLTQALSFYLYDQETGPPGRMHKSVPFGHEYFVY